MIVVLVAEREIGTTHFRHTEQTDDLFNGAGDWPFGLQ